MKCARTAELTRARDRVGFCPMAISRNRGHLANRARRALAATEMVGEMPGSLLKMILRETETAGEMKSSRGDRSAISARLETHPWTAGKRSEIEPDAQSHYGVEMGALEARKGSVVGVLPDARKDALALR
ncbi:hypothetical protein EXIGLDRAFT_405386 [Exidia glandulosa HHB12029]|uniref:Uncharacterized protein n=1 Tax=Exidia glandulosa HHB12029 TaxID=1314781 RepID=A0A165F2G9_EXIGL|nr:hypothetical protein EXIGLDRAFT_183505 [Exidia glandulosa HHB12029]KZV96835.1 hypothetical protein EXIGLDRAFT_405386 [Exidia glandulosa HHB12029]